MKIDDITIVIKTFERPHACARLIESIRRYYKDVPIVVVDDSAFPQVPPATNMLYLRMYFDMGVSAGRNRGVDRVQTRYTFICDDDCVFTQDTDLQKLVDLLELAHVDMLGIRAAGVLYHGDYKILHRDIGIDVELVDPRQCAMRYLQHGGMTVQPCDFIPNIFLARTQILKEHRWDERLKIGEHFAYFFTNRGKFKIAYSDDIAIEHIHEITPGYEQYRSRALDYLKFFMREQGIRRRIDGHGTIEI